jgi:hypothetical protein
MKYIIQDIKDWIRIEPFKMGYFTYIFRRPYYRWQLFKRFMKHPYWGSWELVEPLLDYPFEILNEFYENHKDKISYRWDIDKAEEYEREQLIRQNKDNEELEWLYNWYNVEKPRREEELEYLLDIWNEHHVSWWGKCRDEVDDKLGCLQYYSNPNNKYADYLFKMMNDEETRFEQEKEDALIRLIKIRNRLWD